MTHTKEEAALDLSMFRCELCGKDDFRTRGGYNNHTANCQEKHQQMVNSNQPKESGSSPMRLRSSRNRATVAGQVHQQSEVSHPERGGTGLMNDVDDGEVEDITNGMEDLMDAEIDDESTGGYEAEGSDDENEGSDDESQGYPLMVDGESSDDESDEDDDEEAPIRLIREQFRSYTEGKFPPLNTYEVTCIKLMDVLKRKGSPLNTHPELMEWHLKSSGKMEHYKQLKDCPAYISQKVMLKRLKVRYNMENKFAEEVKVKLPVSGAVVKLTLHDPHYVIQALLTDPRIQDADYFFFDDDPLAPPPERTTRVSNLKTASGFKDTYKAFQIDPEKRQQLLPLVFYLDGSAVSHFHDMEVIPFKVSLGIFNTKARTKDYAWRVLGYVEKVHRQGGRGRKIWTKAGHMEAMDGVVYDEVDGGAVALDGIGDSPKQDLHAMLDVFLNQMGPLFERGFLWDQRFKGVLYRDVHYKLYIAHVRCDNKEAEDICGKYGMRQGKVKMLCRNCHVTLKEGDDHLHKVVYKTEPEIKNMTNNRDLKGLQAISQTYLWNAFWNRPFNQGTKRGIHGACPGDPLHTKDLGVDKRTRDIFFEQIGKDSAPAKEINGLSYEYGRTFARQSEKDLPKATFGRGIQEGKFMGKEYTGILLLMLVMLQSGEGRTILKKSRKGKFKTENQLDDWSMVIELLLMWGAFLSLPEMEKRDVRRLDQKGRYIFYLMRVVAARDKGMGLKLGKIHWMFLHTVDDIFTHGVPSEFDTKANEGHHKGMKKAAKLTQRNYRTFNQQTAKRMTEFEIIDMAIREIEEGLCLWEYYVGLKEEAREQNMEVEVQQKGGEAKEEQEVVESEPMDAMIKVWIDEDTGTNRFKMLGSSKYKKQTRLDDNLKQFLINLQSELAYHGLLPDYQLKIFTRIKRGGHSWRAHPNYRGLGPWRDWAWVDYGRKEGKVACHIWCFVVIPDLEGRRINCGGIRLTKGVFAVVECAKVVGEEALGREPLEVMYPIEKSVGVDERGKILLKKDGKLQKRIFYLADTDAFTAPLCVVPDVGGPINRYFVVEPRSKWAECFIEWLKEDIDDDMVMTEDEREAPEAEGSGDENEQTDTDPSSNDEESE